MFFVDSALFGAQIVAFTLCFSLILLVGAVQANTEISNVRRLVGVWPSLKSNRKSIAEEITFNCKVALNGLKAISLPLQVC